MIFTGDTFRSILDRDKLTFSVNASINNLTGSGSFGFSGEGSTMQWVFNQGKIFDPEGSYVYSYEADQRINLSGAISGSGYQYHLDEKPILFGGDKYTGKTQGFYFNLSGCEANAAVAIKTDEFNYSCTFPTEFTYNEAITGHLSGIDSGYNFQVFSGLVHSPSDFTITGLDTSRNGVVPIKIKCTDASGAKINNTYQFDVDLYTNFGTISKQFSGTSILADPTQGSVLSLSGNTPSGTDSISVSDSSTNGYKDYTLDYTLTNNLALVTGEMPIDVQLTHSSGDTGDFINGHKITGVQLESVANQIFTGTPSITFSSTYSGDTQASGAAVMDDLATGYIYTSGGGGSFVTFKTLVGVSITNSGLYRDPTDITISVSGGNYNGTSITGAYLDVAKLSPRLLDHSSLYFNYNNALDTPVYAESTLFSSGTNGDITYLLSGDPSEISAVPLTTSGDVKNISFTGRWSIATGSSNQLHNFNTGSAWQSIYTGNANESQHPSGNRVSGEQYYNSSNEDENLIDIRVRYRKDASISGTLISGSKVKVISNYLSGAETEKRTYSNLYTNFATISKSPDMNGMPVINSLNDVITGTIQQGNTGSIDIKYSFIESGTSGHDGLGTIKKLDDYTDTYPSLSFGEMTGMFGSGFEYWKRQLEWAFTGLTVNFVNLGLETTTGVATNATYAVGTDNIGDIRIGSSDNISVNWVYYPESTNNFGVSGDSGNNIFLSTTQNWRNETSGSYYDSTLAVYVTVQGYSVPLIAAQSIGMALGIDNEFDNSSITHSATTLTGTNLYANGQILLDSAGGPVTTAVAKNTDLISGDIGCDIDAFTYLYGNYSGSHTTYDEKNALPKISGSDLDEDSIATLSVSGSGTLSASVNITGDYS